MSLSKIQVADAHGSAADESSSVLPRWIVPWLVVVSTLLLTVIAAFTVANNIQTRDRLRYHNSIQNSVQEVRGGIEARFKVYEALLRGLAGLFTAEGGVNQKQFDAFVERLHLQRNYPELQGLGFALRVPPDQRSAVVARMREQGWPGFHLWPDGDRPEYTTIEYLLPRNPRNDAAIGFDMYSDPVRRQAMEQARDTGTPTASGLVKLVQEIDGPAQAGFLIYVPVYRGTPETEEQRRDALVGYAYCPLRADDMLGTITDTDQDTTLEWSVYDGPLPGPEHLLHHHAQNRAAPLASNASFRPVEPLQLPIAGRLWTLQFSARPDFGPSTGWGAGAAILGVGAAIALALFVATNAQVRARAQAERNAMEVVRSQRAVAESERRFRTLFEQSPLSIQIFGRDGCSLLANHAWQDLWDATPRELEGYNCLEDANLQKSGMISYVRRAFAGEAVTMPPMRYDPAGIGRHGRARWIQSHLYPIKEEDRDGQPPVTREVVLIIQDVTDVKESQEAVQRSEEQLRLVIDTVPALIAYVDREQRYRFNNRDYIEWFGKTPEQLQGRHVRDVLNEADYEAALPHIQAALAGRQVTYEARRQRLDGEHRFTSITYVPHRNAAGEVEGFVSLVNDITERTRAEEERATLLNAERAARAEAETANRTKDEFLATLSHELRTPLNAILGWAQLLRMGGMDAEDTGHALETIERNAKVQAQLVEDLLDLSRIISGKLRLELQRVDLPAVVEAALDSVRPTTEAKGVRLMPVLDSHATPVLGDPQRLQQVIWNLLTNAIKFTPTGGRVEVYLQQTGPRQAEITVADTGQGIAPDFLPYVFDRLRQADSSSTRRHGGLGLGLAIVRHLVELHGGSVRASSRGEGRGATFTVTLPLADPKRLAGRMALTAPNASDESGSGDGKLAGVRVLVVDDESDARELISHVLRRGGAEVTIASSAQEAMQTFANAPPDVLVSDISMPDEDGYSLLRKVRGLHESHGGRVPAIALTALARKEDRREALLAGYQMHLSKPIEPGELIAAVATLTTRPG